MNKEEIEQYAQGQYYQLEVLRRHVLGIGSEEGEACRGGCGSGGAFGTGCGGEGCNNNDKGTADDEEELYEGDLIIIIGDHQPPLVMEQNQPEQFGGYQARVHVLASNKNLLNDLSRVGLRLA